MAQTRIADFEVGRPVEGTFAVVRKQRRRNKNGDPYLVLELSDASGRIEGRVWDNAEYFDRQVQEGDKVVAIGRPSLFRDQLQFDIRRLQRAGGEFTEAFVPVASRGLDELAGELDFLVDELGDPFLAGLVRAVWQGRMREQLLRSPATQGEHHSYLGGLVEHTVAVATLCMAAADRHDSLDRELLLAAALLHDVGRAREITVEAAIGLDDAGALQGHVLLAHELLLEAAGGSAPDHQQWPKLLHAIASHHGPIDRCRTREAAVLAQCNALDARLGSNAR